MSTTTTASTTPTRLTTGEVGRKLGIHPRDLSDLLYRSRALADAFEVVAGRRLIDARSLPAIQVEARRAGLLPPLQSA